MKYLLPSEAKKKPEPEVVLSLDRNLDGSVSVMANGFYVLRFQLNGTIKRVGSIPPDMGFLTNRAGCIMWSDEFSTAP